MHNNTAWGIVSDAIRGFLITSTLLALCLAFMSPKANATTAHEHTGSGDCCSECREYLGPEMCSECGKILDASWKYCENCGSSVDDKDCESEDVSVNWPIVAIIAGILVGLWASASMLITYWEYRVR